MPILSISTGFKEQDMKLRPLKSPAASMETIGKMAINDLRGSLFLSPRDGHFLNN